MRTGSLLSRVVSTVPFLALLVAPACAIQTADDEGTASQSDELKKGHASYTLDDAFATPGPFAIGHRGSGVNLGEDPTRPIENTIPAFREGYKDGARMVELDVQLTSDGAVVVYHDDFLSDYTCINTLTREQLEERAPQIPSLRAALAQAMQFNRKTPDGSGLMMIELKPPSPMCDPADTSDVVLAAAAVGVIAKAGMTEQSIVTSFSPTMLAAAAAAQPGVARALDVTALQLLPPEVVEQLSGMPVTEITKANGLGLRWAEVGPLYRLPGYSSINEFIGTAYYLGCYSTLMDRLIPLQAPDQTAALVQGIHGLGMKSVVWTVNDAAEWQFFASAGVDAIVIDDVPLGVSLQP